MVANNLDPDKTSPHFWVCTVCLRPFYGFSCKNGLKL